MYTAVIERRLRPIYDSLESGNTRKALQEAEKVLKKNSQLQCARALKALALLRLGKEEESQQIILDLEKETPYDDATLQVMTFCYKETEQLEKICSLYAEASKSDPGNEEILSHLFMSHVRVNNYKSQQAVALQLYKLKPKNPYYFWAVMSVILQALRGPDCKNSSKSKLLLALAQRMIDKLITENKLDAEQEVQLYLSILQHQEKHQEALDFLIGPVCTKLYPGVPVTTKIDLLKKINKWTDVNTLLKELLLTNLDRWDYYKEYLISCFELQKIKDKTEGTDYNVDMCHEFLCELIEKGKKVRGPYLARLELHRLLTVNNINPNNILGDFLELLVEYFRLFGDKSCCSNDLKLFLDNLEPSRRAGLASRLLQDCGISSTTLPQSTEQMQKHISSLQISRICGAHTSLSVEHLTALYTALSLHYEHGMNAFGINMLPTDIGPCDQYALLAVYVMYDLAIKSNSSQHLIEALCLLHYLLCNSPSNFHAKLLCLQIYHILGCGWGAYKTYESLEIKHIQLDSMGYLHCAMLPTMGIATIAKQLYDTTLKFFTTSYKDSVEYLAMSYKFGSFSKLEEFMDFRDRISNSLHFSSISVEALLIEIVCFCWTNSQNMIAFKNMNISVDEDKINYDEITDNRDLTVVVKWDPTIGETDNYEKESFQQDTELLQLRATLLRIIACCVDYILSFEGTIETEDKSFNNLKLVTEKWQELFLRIRKMNYKPTSNKYLVNLLPSRLHKFLEMSYENVFFKLSTLVLDMFNNKGESTEKLAEDLKHEFDNIFDNLKSKIDEYNKSGDVIWNRRDVQEIIVNSIEILSLCSFIITVCYERVSSNMNINHIKKKKKPVQNKINEQQNKNISDKERQLIITDILKYLKKIFTEIDIQLDLWITPNLSESLSETLSYMSLNPKVEVLVNGTFKENHSITVKELKSIVKDKIKMVSK